MFKMAVGHSAAVSLIIEFLTAAMQGIVTSFYKGYKHAGCFILNDTTETKCGPTLV